jgi:3-hydroxybutyryl-CoA dehydrogenase
MNIAVIAGSLETSTLLQPLFTHIPSFKIYKEVAEVEEGAADVLIDFSFVPDVQHIAALQEFLPRPVFINSVLHTLHETDEKFIRFNGWPGFLNTNAVETVIPGTQQQPAKKVFEMLKWNHIPVPDICGFITARVVAMIINEAYFAFGEGVSTKEEIDIAMKLGTNYPYGPFEWVGKIGIGNIYALLQKLSLTDGRYQPAPALEAAMQKNTIV